jgi:hypothetical protein
MLVRADTGTALSVVQADPAMRCQGYAKQDDTNPSASPFLIATPRDRPSCQWTPSSPLQNARGRYMHLHPSLPPPCSLSSALPPSPLAFWSENLAARVQEYGLPPCSLSLILG